VRDRFTPFFNDAASLSTSIRSIEAQPGRTINFRNRVVRRVKRACAGIALTNIKDSLMKSCNARMSSFCSTKWKQLLGWHQHRSPRGGRGPRSLEAEVTELQPNHHRPREELCKGFRIPRVYVALGNLLYGFDVRLRGDMVALHRTITPEVVHVAWLSLAILG